jgi:hypothetical protein
MKHKTSLVEAVVLSGCHRFYTWSAAVARSVRSITRTYVKERVCGCIFLQVHLVHVFQSFDPHGDDCSVMFVVVDVAQQ